MTQPLERDSSDLRAMQSAGALAYIGAELDRIQTQLERAPQWQPGHQIQAEINWFREHIGAMEAAWNRKLVVALVGPSGAGKSTLLNALTKRQLSVTGLTRPTTREIVVYTQSRADLDGLWEDVDPNRLHVESDPTRALDNLILVDTPDTNTLPENQSLLERVLSQADLLLTVFAAQNPKLQDNIGFLAPYVGRLAPNAVIPVINQVDRVDRRELEEEIIPDLLQLVHSSWGIDAQRIFLISARANTSDASFFHDEQPLHDLDQFGELTAFITSTLNQAGQASDRRLTRAEYLLDAIRQHCAELLTKGAPARGRAEMALDQLRKQMDTALTEALTTQMQQSSDITLHANLYGRIAPRWWGPIGWLVALWALILRLIASVRSWVRPRRALVHLGASDDSPAEAIEMPDTTLWQDQLLHLQAEQWPEVATSLSAAGFPELARGELQVVADQAQHQQLDTRWRVANEEQLASLSRRLTTWPLQVLWNAPVLGLVAWSCVQIIQGFLVEAFLPADYFRHAAIAAGVVWALCFVLYQFLVANSLGRPFRQGVARKLTKKSTPWLQPISSQFQALEALEQECLPNRR